MVPMPRTGRPRKYLAERERDLTVASGMFAADHPEGWNTARKLCEYFALGVRDAYNDHCSEPSELWRQFRYRVDVASLNDGTAHESRLTTECTSRQSAIAADTGALDAGDMALILAREFLAPQLSAVPLHNGELIVGLAMGQPSGETVAYSNRSTQTGSAVTHEDATWRLLERLCRTTWRNATKSDLAAGQPYQAACCLASLEWAEGLQAVRHTALATPGGMQWIVRLKAQPWAPMHEVEPLRAVAGLLCYFRARKACGAALDVPHLRLCSAHDCEQPAFIESYAGKITQGKFYCEKHRGPDDQARLRKARHRRVTGSTR